HVLPAIPSTLTCSPMCTLPHTSFPTSPFRSFSTSPPTTEIYTLSLHDALPIYPSGIRETGCRRIVSISARCNRHSAPLESRSTRSEEHTSELQSPDHLVCRLLLEKKKLMSINQQRLESTKERARRYGLDQHKQL